MKWVFSRRLSAECWRLPIQGNCIWHFITVCNLYNDLFPHDTLLLQTQCFPFWKKISLVTSCFLQNTNVAFSALLFCHTRKGIFWNICRSHTYIMDNANAITLKPMLKMRNLFILLLCYDWLHCWEILKTTPPVLISIRCSVVIVTLCGSIYINVHTNTHICNNSS